jgi:hypothetical protein
LLTLRLDHRLKPDGSAHYWLRAASPSLHLPICKARSNYQASPEDPALALCLLLAGVPVLSSFADDETTQTLYSNAFQETAVGASDGVLQYFFAPTQHINTVVTAISCVYRVPVNVQTLYAQLATMKDSKPRFNLQTFIKATYQTSMFYITVTDNATPDDLVCTISGYHS